MFDIDERRMNKENYDATPGATPLTKRQWLHKMIDAFVTFQTTAEGLHVCTTSDDKLRQQSFLNYMLYMITDRYNHKNAHVVTNDFKCATSRINEELENMENMDDDNSDNSEEI